MASEPRNDLRAKVLEADDIQKETVNVPEWDVDIEVRGMSGLQRAKFLRNSTDKEGEVAFEKFYPQLLIATCFDPESGEQLFDPADADALNTKAGAALERVAGVAQRLSGLGGVDVEEAQGNSNGSPKNAST